MPYIFITDHLAHPYLTGGPNPPPHQCRSCMKERGVVFTGTTLRSHSWQRKIVDVKGYVIMGHQQIRPPEVMICCDNPVVFSINTVDHWFH